MPWDSLVLPAASAVMPEEYASMLPEVFFQIYYNGATLKSSLLRVWASSKRARAHTDLLVIDGIHNETGITVKKYCYSPVASRPWGVDLPPPRTFCNCATIVQDPRWRKLQYNDDARFEEYFACYRSACKHVSLRVAVFAKGLQSIQVRGTQVVLQEFISDMGRFPLDSYDHFTIRPTVVRFPHVTHG